MRANDQTYSNTTPKSNTSGAKDGNKLVRNPPAEVRLAEKGRGASRTLIGGGGWSRNTRGDKGRRSGGDWSGVGAGWGMGIGLSIGGGGCGGGACGGGGCGGGGC